MRPGPLHLRLALAMGAVMAALALVLLAVVHAGNGRAAQEAAQRMNLGLAAYIGEHLPAPLVDAQGRVQQSVMAQLAGHVMAIHPAVELYLLGPDGRVRAHALGTPAAEDPLGRLVDLRAVAPLLAPGAQPPALPVLGDDPRRPGQRVPVSVAPLPPAGSGYLYVVLIGQAQRSVAAQVAPSLAGRELAAAFALAGLGAALLAFVLLHALTRPLRRLAAQVQRIRTEDAPAAPPHTSEVALLQAAVDALSQRVDTQFRQLQQADRQRRELLSSLSHDLRTPLAILRGQLDTLLLKGPALDEPQRLQAVQLALRHSERLRQHLDDLFELARLDDGQVQPRPEVFCLAELLQDTLQGLQPLARARGVALVLDTGSQRPSPVLADIGLIERVLHNLLDNALRCTPSGGQVRLALHPGGPRCGVSVADTGCGIAPEHLPHIFERHWQARGPQAGGAGLGLAIVRRVLDLHGSTVQVQSTPGLGTRFDFDLPVPPFTGSAAAPAESPPAPGWWHAGSW